MYMYMYIYTYKYSYRKLARVGFEPMTSCLMSRAYWSTESSYHETQVIAR